MTPTDIAFIATALRELTDGIACNAQPISGQESIPELIAQVSAISTDAQSSMRARLRAAFPDIRWSDSEDKQDAQAGDAAYWVYDPIDGTYHFLQRLPLWSSSLALVQHGKPTLALVYDPSLRELFVAHAGHGATLDSQPLRASAKTELRIAVVGTALPPHAAVSADEHALATRVLVETSKHVFVMRQMAAASLQLAYVAAGRLDAYVETGDDVYDWMAGSLLVQEAGGVVSALDGTPFGLHADGVLAAASGLHGPLQDVVASGVIAAH